MYCKAITKQGHVCCFKALHSNIHCKRHSKISYDECPICYDNIYVPLELNACGHTFCKNCITSWGNTCPLCRSLSDNVLSQNVLFDKVHYKLTKLISNLDLVTHKNDRILAIKQIYDVVFNNYYTLFHSHDHLLHIVVSKFIELYDNSDCKIMNNLNTKLQSMLEKFPLKA